MVTLNNQEIDEMKLSIEAGKLPPDALENHFKEEERRVFGSEFKRDKAGVPIENGIGSAGRETANHFKAMKMNELLGLEEPGTAARLEREWRELQAKKAVVK